MEIWDGYLIDGTLANQDLTWGKPIPKGLYHLVSKILEETGISADDFVENGQYASHDIIYYSFLCVTYCDKSSVSIQDGETISYKWISEKDFITFVNSIEMIDIQKDRYHDFL